MKNRLKLILFCAIVLLSIALIWLSHKQENLKPIPTTQVFSTNIQPANPSLRKMNLETQNVHLNQEIYTSSFEFEQKIGSGWGDSTGTKRFYVTLKNGQEYGRIFVELFAYYSDHIPGLIRIEYAINPTGSRILR